MLRPVFRFGLLVAALAAFAPSVSAQSATIGYSWLGATNQDVVNTSSFATWPPDTHGSVGINHFVQAVNGRYTFFNKDGTTAATAQSTNNFWTSRVGLSTGSTNYTDPRIYYDPMSQRWFAVEITGVSSNNRILLGRSDTSNPTGTWHGFTINGQSGSFTDYPTLAVDANAVYVGTNNFNGSGGHTIVSVPLNGANGFLQNPTGAGAVASVTHAIGGLSSGSTPHGVTDISGATAGSNSGLLFGTGVTIGPDSVLTRVVVNNPGAAGATLTLATSGNGGYIVTQPTETALAFASQSGTANTLDNGDDRNSSAIYRVGNLIYMARAVDDGGGVAGRSVARWTILSVNGSNAVTVVREGTIDLGGNTHAFFPAIAANSRGDFVLSFSRSSPSEFPSIWAVVGSTSDFSNWSVGSPMQLQAGLTFQNHGSGGSNRWGDYSSATLDPADPGSFWITSEYMHGVDPPGTFLNANDNWGTRVVEVIPTIAGEVRWKNPAAGTFATAANWAAGATPISSDHIIFSRWSSTNYQVDLPAGTTSINRLSIRQTGTGTVTINIASGSTLSLTNTSATTPSLAISEFQGQSNVAFSGGGTLQSNYATIAAASGGVGNLTITGSGTTWNNANDLFIGGSSTAAGGTGSLTVSGGAAANIAGTLKIWTPASTVTVTGTGSALSVAGLTNEPGSTPTITVNTGAALNITNGLGTTYSGTITGAGAVNKSGAGIFTLTGNNTYSGQTTVSAGTLFVNGQTGSNSGTGTGPLVINGGIVGGNGRIGGTVAVNSTGILAPGLSVGTLTVAGNTVFNTGGKFAVEVAAVGTNDLLAVQGSSTTLDFKAGSILDLSLLAGFTNTASANYTLATLPVGSGNNILNDGAATTDGAILGTFIQGTGPSGTVIIQPSGFALTDGDQFQLLRSGDNLTLQFTTPVPEPSTVLAIAFATLAAGALLRRHLRLQSSAISH